MIYRLWFNKRIKHKGKEFDVADFFYFSSFEKAVAAFELAIKSFDIVQLEKVPKISMYSVESLIENGTIKLCDENFEI